LDKERRDGLSANPIEAGAAWDEPFGPESFDPELTTEGLTAEVLPSTCPGPEHVKGSRVEARLSFLPIQSSMLDVRCSMLIFLFLLYQSIRLISMKKPVSQVLT
jgi:hypothetical protein